MVGKSRSNKIARRLVTRVFAVAGMAIGVLSGLAALPMPATAEGSSAAVMMYHRFGESRYPSTNIQLEQFEAHLAEIASGGFNVMPLPEIVAAVRAGRELPPKTIAITIDDAFLSVWKEAWPRLRLAQLPFTLFIATRSVDRNSPGYMSWDQIKELAAAGVTIGSQTVSHPHMPLLSDERNAAELRNSSARFEEMLGKRPTLIAYPYGEYSLAVRRVTKQADFVAGFGQHSGVMHPGSDFFYLPRFALNEAHGDVKRFRLAGNTLPLPASDITPADPFLKQGANPPLFGFTVGEEFSKKLRRLACYASGQGKVRIERLGDTRVEVRMNKPFGVGRTRVNCTLPAGKGRWHWLGRQFLVPPR
ncbi:MAG: polysaccharide deacetylase family protein [Alphaproteobacteria bacterium]